MTVSNKLTLGDISDLRAYERERHALRSKVIAMKQRRRIALGTIITVSFENRDTMRYQIQEMARVEKLITDEEIQVELDIYNALVPDPATLCATLFIELTSDESIREWLPRLVGIERSIVFHLGDGSTVRSRPEAQHEQQLTRTDTTSAVHYLVFSFEASQMASFASGPVVLGIDHPSYSETADLLDSTVQELLGDLLAVS